MSLIKNIGLSILCGLLIASCGGGGGDGGGNTPVPVDVPAVTVADETTGVVGAVGDNTTDTELSTQAELTDGKGSTNSTGAAMCGGESSSDNPYQCCDTAGNLTKNNGLGNCVWYAWKAAREKMGLYLPKWGNANLWLSKATDASQKSGADFTVQSEPVANSIAVWVKGTYGHVAYVKSINNDGTITVIEQNCTVPGYPGSKTREKVYSKNFFTGYIVKKGSVPPASPTVSSISISSAKVNTKTVFDVYGSNLNSNIKFTLVDPVSCSSPTRNISDVNHIQWGCTMGGISGSATFKVIDVSNSSAVLGSKEFSILGNSTNTAPVISDFQIFGNIGRAYGSFTVTDAESDDLTKLRVHLSQNHDGSDCYIDPLVTGYNGTSKPGNFNFDTSSSGNTCSTLLKSAAKVYAKIEAWDSSLQASKVFNSFEISSAPPPPSSPSVSSVKAYNYNVGEKKMYSGLYSGNNTVITIAGVNLPQTSVVDVSGLSCNISAPVTASALFQTGNSYSTTPNTSSGKYTYPIQSGSAEGFAIVCTGVQMKSGTSYTVTLKTAPGGSTIGSTYQFKVN